jgi:hypothetical protein
MVVIILLVSKESVMGAFTASRPLINLGWIATAIMGAAAVRMFIPGWPGQKDLPVSQHCRQIGIPCVRAVLPFFHFPSDCFLQNL